MTYRSIAAALSLATFGLVAFSCASPSDDTVIVATRRPEGGAPSFTEVTDAGTAEGSISEPELACVGTECPWPYATCPTPGGELGYKCEVNLLTDNNNCGACGNVCPGSFPGQLNMGTLCVDGACQRECSAASQTSNYKDCNGLVDDGCEINVASDVDNCGTCGNKCPEGVDGIRRCDQGICGCPPGRTDCGTAGCKDIFSDNSNCGACGNVCPPPEAAGGVCPGADAGALPPNTVYNCSGGVCGKLTCAPSFRDCNGSICPDGCETDVSTDPNNCGACGSVCTPDQICLETSSGSICACAPNETLCNGSTCVDLLTDPKNCGFCGLACGGNFRAVHSIGTCQKGFCESECEQGWGDCDGDLRNGCETNLLLNAAHCGTCGNRCEVAAGQPCVAGKCLMVECDGGPVAK